MIQCSQGFLGCVLAHQLADIDCGVQQIGTNLDAHHAYESKPWIAQFKCNHLSEFVLQKLAYSELSSG